MYPWYNRLVCMDRPSKCYFRSLINIPDWFDLFTRKPTYQLSPANPSHLLFRYIVNSPATNLSDALSPTGCRHSSSATPGTPIQSQWPAAFALPLCRIAPRTADPRTNRNDPAATWRHRTACAFPSPPYRPLRSPSRPTPVYALSPFQLRA
jgi:hypothetical protein